MSETYGRTVTLEMDGTPIAQVISFQPPSVTVTTQDSTVNGDASVQETATMADFGTAKATIKYDQSLHQTLLQAAAACLPHDWTFECTEFAEDVGAAGTWTITGPLKGFSFGSTDMKGLVTADIEIRVNDFDEAEPGA